MRAEILQLNELQKKLKEKHDQEIQQNVWNAVFALNHLTLKKFDYEKELAVLKGKTDSLQESQDKLLEKTAADTQHRLEVAEEQRSVFAFFSRFAHVVGVIAS